MPKRSRAMPSPPPTSELAESYLDPSRWRLSIDNGRQTWLYQEPSSDAPAQSTIERYHLGTALPSDFPRLSRATSPAQALTNAITFYTKLQCEDGHWANDYGGPLFLLPGLLIACYVCSV